MFQIVIHYFFSNKFFNTVPIVLRLAIICFEKLILYDQRIKVLLVLYLKFFFLISFCHFVSVWVTGDVDIQVNMFTELLLDI